MNTSRRSVIGVIAAMWLFSGCADHGSGGAGGGGGTFSITTTAAAFGIVGNTYSSTPSTANGTAPFTWSLFGGSLPAGLSLNTSTGAVTGTPTAAGNSTATLRVVDGAGKVATGSVLFAIHPRTDRVSVDGNGTAGNGASSGPSISGDGSLVAFVSQATNLVNSVSGSQIYLHNRQTNQIELISRDSNATTVNEGDAASSAPAVSSTDGRFVAFASQAANLVTGVSGSQVYVRDRQTGQTTVISKSSSGVVGTGTSSTPAISADGRYIAFVSDSTNLVTGVSGTQVYRHDRQTGVTILISKDNNVTPNPGNAASATPAVSSDGRFVSFASLATNLVTGVAANQQIYLHDTQTGITSLISKDTSTTPPTAGNGASSRPVINGTGQFIAFVSSATNLVSGFSGQQIYLHDRNTGANGTNSLISRDNSGTPQTGNQNSSAPSITSDGRFISFTSLSTNLVTGISGQQIYLHDRNGPTTSLISRDNTGPLVAGNGASDSASINASGGFVAFSSQASNLVAGGVAPSDIYVRALP